jgi:hypothetical protein
MSEPRRLPNFRELGASLVASPQAADHSLWLTKEHELAFPVLRELRPGGDPGLPGSVHAAR